MLASSLKAGTITDKKGVFTARFEPAGRVGRHTRVDSAAPDRARRLHCWHLPDWRGTTVPALLHLSVVDRQAPTAQQSQRRCDSGSLLPEASCCQGPLELAPIEPVTAREAIRRVRSARESEPHHQGLPPPRDSYPDLARTAFRPE